MHDAVDVAREGHWLVLHHDHIRIVPALCCCRSVQFISEAIGTLDRRINQASTDNW